MAVTIFYNEVQEAGLGTVDRNFLSERMAQKSPLENIHIWLLLAMF